MKTVKDLIIFLAAQDPEMGLGMVYDGYFESLNIFVQNIENKEILMFSNKQCHAESYDTADVLFHSNVQDEEA